MLKSPSDPEAVSDARRFGFDEAAVSQVAGRLAAEQFAGVWPENVWTVLAFLVAATQWRTATIVDAQRWRVAWLGLDYAGARAGIEAAGIRITPELWGGLMIMEAEARAALNGASG